MYYTGLLTLFFMVSKNKLRGEYQAGPFFFFPINSTYSRLHMGELDPALDSCVSRSHLSQYLLAATGSRAADLWL